MKSVLQIFLAALVSALASVCIAAAESADFNLEASYAHRIPLQTTASHTYYRVILPFQTYLLAQTDDLRDLRIFNAQHEALPYGLLYPDASPVTTRHTSDVKWFPVRESLPHTGAEQLRIQRDATGAVTALEISASERHQENLRGWVLDTGAIHENFYQLSLDWDGGTEGFQQLQIDASDDLSHWQNWGDAQIARLSFNGEQISQQDISLPGMHTRYVRLMWQNPQQAPDLRRAQISSAQVQEVAPALQWSTPQHAQSSTKGELIWTLPRPVPVVTLRVLLTEANTLAPVEVLVRNDDKQAWRVAARKVLYRLPVNGSEQTQDSISLSGEIVQQFKLRLDQRGTGLQAVQMQFAVRPPQLLFLARGTAPFVLALGRTDSPSGSLPLGSLMPGFDQAKLTNIPQASLDMSAPETNTTPTAASPAQSDARWKTASLWAVLLLGVGMLLGMAWSLLRTLSKNKS